MASSLISGAIALILILIGGYMIAGGILSIGETITLTQTEMTMVQEKIRQTDLNITHASYSGGNVTLIIENTGFTSFKISDIGMDLYLCDSSSSITSRVTDFYPRIDPSDDIINKGFWDPGEILKVDKITSEPKWVWFTTPNGVTGSRDVGT